MKSVDQFTRKGVFTLKHFRDGKQIGEDVISDNLVTTEGRDYIANIAYNGNGASAQNIWYVALYKNNVTPAAGDSSSDVIAKYGELSAELVNATRPVWVPNDGNSGSSSSNSDSVATFTMDAGAASTTIYGALFISTSGKASATGILMAASAFTPSRTVLANDVLNLTYEIQLNDA